MLKFNALIVLLYSALFLYKEAEASWETKCFGAIGCFSTGGAFARSKSWLVQGLHFMPESPQDIQTDYIFYTRNIKNTGQHLKALDTTEDIKLRWKDFSSKRLTKIIVHGFLDDVDTVSWMEHMKDELLVHGDYNTIIVDWSNGNKFPYTQAAANTRVVGAQVAYLIKTIMKEFNATADQFHIIGHSLGAHIAGYAGERVPGLARISGLDPAGPYFTGTETTVRLDPTDAVFVDTIHTDSKLNSLSLTSPSFGTIQQDGHMDFFPNHGHDMPGCSRAPLSIFYKLIQTGSIFERISEAGVCSHLRAIKFFTESINSKCPFRSFPCNSDADFTAKKCHSCTVNGGCASMGFHSDKFKPEGGKHMKYFTTTAANRPFCQRHLDVKLNMSSSSSATNERGTVFLRIHSEIGSTPWLHFNNEPINFEPGKTYNREVVIPHNPGKILSVDLKWKHSSGSPLNGSWSFGKVNWFGLRDPKLYLHEVDIVRNEEQDKQQRFCRRNDTPVKNNDDIAHINKC